MVKKDPLPDRRSGRPETAGDDPHWAGTRQDLHTCVAQMCVRDPASVHSSCHSLLSASFSRETSDWILLLLVRKNGGTRQIHQSLHHRPLCSVSRPRPLPAFPFVSRAATMSSGRSLLFAVTCLLSSSVVVHGLRANQGEPSLRCTCLIGHCSPLLSLSLCPCERNLSPLSTLSISSLSFLI